MNNSLRLIVITLLLAVSHLSAATLFVGPGGFSTIQQAVDAAAAGDEIVVTNGTYATGTKTAGGYTLPNRVAVDKPLTLRSVNGPQVTVIRGYRDPEPYEYGMVRCVYLTNGASLYGFTLAGGGCYDRVGALPPGSKSGGGVFCESSSAIVSNCVLSGNAALDGGGAYGGTLLNCKLTGNSTVGNASSGGAVHSALYNCVLTGNSGGGWGCTFTNCTITGNSVGGAIFGVAGSTLVNCIVYYNTAPGVVEYTDSTLDYCCTTPLPSSGVGNITNAPLFADYAGGNLRLRGGACVNHGNDAFVAGNTDLDGRPRIVAGTVDIGAYEFKLGVSGAFIGWLEGYGLPTDGSADYADADADGLNNWEEWRCGTCPTDPLSALRLVSAAPSGASVTVRWKSVAGVNYFLKSSPDLASPFTFVATNILGQADATTYADTNATGPGPFFYRVGVASP